jgi:LCP family protein required for cell wall assembly
MLEVSASPTEIVTEDATILALAPAEEELAKTAKATLLPSLTPDSAESPALWPTIQTLLLTASPQPEWPTPLSAPSLPPISLAPNSQPNANPTIRTLAPTSATLTLPQLRPTIPGGELLTGTNDIPPNSDAVTILLLGNDRRPGESDVPRTDAMLLVRLDPQKGRIALFSLPRDLWTEIPGHGFERINSAYTWGEIAKIPGGGLGLARETISKLLGIPVDYVMMIGFEGFIHLIDQIDGITVNVDRELYDDQFPTMDYKYTVAYFMPGSQIMDGVRALAYGRIRHPDSDFMRILRQQVLLLAIGARLRERGDLQTSLTLGQTAERLTSLVETDLPKTRALELAWAFRDFDLTKVERYALSESTVSFGVGNDLYALVPSQPDLDRLTKLFLGSVPPN